jgi:hypothetical protein
VTLLSAAAGDAVTPTGIFSGITPLAASTQAIASEAMTEDLARVSAAVATVAGNNPVVLILSPRQAASMKLRTDIGQFEVYASSALADGTVAAIATNALASVGDLVPEFAASLEATFHMQTTALPLVAASGTPAAPAKSLWQTDCLALRLRCSLNWALRSPQGAAWITGCNW